MYICRLYIDVRLTALAVFCGAVLCSGLQEDKFPAALAAELYTFNIKYSHSNVPVLSGTFAPLSIL